jgi:hypothetical protein
MRRLLVMLGVLAVGVPAFTSTASAAAPPASYSCAIDGSVVFVKPLVSELPPRGDQPVKMKIRARLTRCIGAPIPPGGISNSYGDAKIKADVSFFSRLRTVFFADRAAHTAYKTKVVWYPGDPGTDDGRVGVTKPSTFVWRNRSDTSATINYTVASTSKTYPGLRLVAPVSFRNIPASGEVRTFSFGGNASVVRP